MVRKFENDPPPPARRAAQLGHGPLLHPLRAAPERRDDGPVRVHASVRRRVRSASVCACVRECAPPWRVTRSRRYPNPERYWDLIARHKVTQFYTAPTALRALIRFGPEVVHKHDLSTLRILGSVGEPINPEAWRWCAVAAARARTTPTARARPL